MGRPPCCDKIGVKKGPWTPEEDIILVSYIQQHGPGNWRAVPTNTGLARCSKSCRLRWTNYLRPGIKRGNFTEHEEKMIIHLQALLGNRWAAIASYLPQRTDNDIKNYWNTHLRKKLNKKAAEEEGGTSGASSSRSNMSKGQWERRLQTDIHMAKKALCEALSLDKPVPDAAAAEQTHDQPLQSSPTSSCYASSAENISRLLQTWMKTSPKSSYSYSETNTQNSFTIGAAGSSSSPSEGTTTPEGFDSLFGSFNSSNADASVDEAGNAFTPENLAAYQVESKPTLQNRNVVAAHQNGFFQDQESQVPLTLLEKWLFEETNAAPAAQDELMGLAMGETAHLF